MTALFLTYTSNNCLELQTITKGALSVDLMKYIENMREFREREGYYPEFGKPDRRDPENPESEQPTRPRLIPRDRRRPWK
jgi:hypothetical protein